MIGLDIVLFLSMVWFSGFVCNLKAITVSIVEAFCPSKRALRVLYSKQDELGIANCTSNNS
jgi:hypothetical protein